MSNLFGDIRITAPNYSKYNSSITLSFQEACDLYETRLPDLIRKTLAEQKEEIADYKMNITRAKKLGLI